MCWFSHSLDSFPKETAVKSSTMNIMMETDRTLLDEVVVVGYGMVFKKEGYICHHHGVCGGHRRRSGS